MRVQEDHRADKGNSTSNNTQPFLPIACVHHDPSTPYVLPIWYGFVRFLAIFNNVTMKTHIHIR